MDALVAERQLAAERYPQPDRPDTAPKQPTDCRKNPFAQPDAGREFRANRCELGVLIESCPRISHWAHTGFRKDAEGLMMSPFYVVLSAVMVLTLFSAATAGILVALGAGRTQAQRSVIEKLIHIALLGASAVIALLGRVQTH